MERNYSQHLGSFNEIPAYSLRSDNAVSQKQYVRMYDDEMEESFVMSKPYKANENGIQTNSKEIMEYANGGKSRL